MYNWIIEEKVSCVLSVLAGSSWLGETSSKLLLWLFCAVLCSSGSLGAQLSSLKHFSSSIQYHLSNRGLIWSGISWLTATHFLPFPQGKASRKLPASFPSFTADQGNRDYKSQLLFPLYKFVQQGISNFSVVPWPISRNIQWRKNEFVENFMPP